MQNTRTPRGSSSGDFLMICPRVTSSASSHSKSTSHIILRSRPLMIGGAGKFEIVFFFFILFNSFSLEYGYKFFPLKMSFNFFFILCTRVLAEGPFIFFLPREGPSTFFPVNCAEKF